MDGEGFDWNLYTFGRPPLSQRRIDRLTAVLRSFKGLYGPHPRISDFKSTVYEFRHGRIASSRPTVDPELVRRDEEEIDFETMMPHTDADFDSFASTIRPRKNSVSCCEGSSASAALIRPLRSTSVNPQLVRKGHLQEDLWGSWRWITTSDDKTLPQPLAICTNCVR